VLEIDQRGKVRLSMRVVDQETGEELEDARPPREPRGNRGGGDRGRGPRRDGGRDGGGRGRDGGGRGRDGGGRGRSSNNDSNNDGGGDIPLPASITED